MAVCTSSACCCCSWFLRYFFFFLFFGCIKRQIVSWDQHKVRWSLGWKSEWMQTVTSRRDCAALLCWRGRRCLVTFGGGVKIARMWLTINKLLIALNHESVRCVLFTFWSNSRSPSHSLSLSLFHSLTHFTPLDAKAKAKQKFIGLRSRIALSLPMHCTKILQGIVSHSAKSLNFKTNH